jgi:hypothetical protein
MQGISLLAAKRLASQEGLCSMEWAGQLSDRFSILCFCSSHSAPTGFRLQTFRLPSGRWSVKLNNHLLGRRLGEHSATPPLPFTIYLHGMVLMTEPAADTRHTACHAQPPRHSHTFCRLHVKSLYSYPAKHLVPYTVKKEIKHIAHPVGIE